MISAWFAYSSIATGRSEWLLLNHSPAVGIASQLNGLSYLSLSICFLVAALKPSSLPKQFLEPAMRIAVLGFALFFLMSVILTVQRL